jgi:hypothetical protein
MLLEKMILSCFELILHPGISVQQRKYAWFGVRLSAYDFCHKQNMMGKIRDDVCHGWQ